MASKVIYLKLKRAEDGRHGTKIPHYTTSPHLILTLLFPHLDCSKYVFSSPFRQGHVGVLCSVGTEY
jgi:hypothetical protein